jgi:outer membrane biosynthesis protein TonB
MSLTTASERIARSLAEAERQRGRNVTVRHLVAGADSVPEPEPIPPAERSATPEPISEPEPAPAEPSKDPEPADPLQRPEPAREPEPPLAREPEPALAREPEPALAREPEPARTPTPTRRRRLLLYALAAASIIVAAALVDHWGVMPRVGANTSSSSTQVGGSPHRPQLLPPLCQPPVMHFSNAGNATSISIRDG